MKKIDDLFEARKVLEVEANCLLATKNRLDQRFSQAIELIVSSHQKSGKVVVLGIGKSGKIASKVAATLSSMGTPAIYLHPTEALHGDLGIVGSHDVLLAYSYSGNSEEVLRVINELRARPHFNQLKIIAIIGNMTSALAQIADVVLDGSVAQEACPLNLAPTSSTTVALALGDAIAAVLSLHFNFKEDQFAVNHPGGALGRRLTLMVKDLMKAKNDLPWVLSNALMEEVVNMATEKKLGAVLVRDAHQKFRGIITDGDIRRALKHKEKFFSLTANDIMTVNPVAIRFDEKALKALELMENRSSQISVLPVIDDSANCIGLIRLHDLIGKL